MKKKLLVLNGTHSDIPLIQAGKKLGYYVITTGNNPTLIGHQYADEYIPADFSDYKLIASIAAEHKIDAVCSCANDFGAITASYVAEQLGLPGHDSFETTLVLHHKDKFKELSQRHNLRTPEAKGFHDESLALEYALSLNYPVIVKPIDLTGGKGISKAIAVEEKKAAIHKAFDMSPSKRIVVEQFIEGTYHSFSTFIVDQKCAFAFSDNEYFSSDPLCCITSAGPADKIESVHSILVEECEKLAKILNLKDGRLHLQYVMDAEGNPYVLEYTRRMSGDLYSYPVQRALGIDTPEWIVKAECGLNCKDCPKDIVQHGYVGRHCLRATRNGTIKNYSIDPELEKYIFNRVVWISPSLEITNYKAQRFGVIFFEFPSRDIMDKIVSRIDDYISVEYN